MSGYTFGYTVQISVYIMMVPYNYLRSFVYDELTSSYLIGRYVDDSDKFQRAQSNFTRVFNIYVLSKQPSLLFLGLLGDQ